MENGKILIVEDEIPIREAIEECLQEAFPDAVVKSCGARDKAVDILRTIEFDVVIADMKLEEDEAGYDLLLFIKKQNPGTQVLVHTGRNDVRNAVRCMRAGCFDYLLKGTGEAELLESVHRAIEFSHSSIDRDSLRERLILSDWDEIHKTMSPARKGMALESLCSLLFSTVPGWQRVECRVKSTTEEIDLVIRNESRDEFWRRFETFILVECKNWSKKHKPGRKEFDAFYAKIKRKGAKDCRLGLFVSLNSVAKTFKTELRQIAKEDTVIVIVEEDHLWRMICAEERSEFLKKLIAEQVFA